MNKNNSAVIYIRLATENLGELRLFRHLLACALYAQQNGFTVIGEFHELGSGSVIERPVLQSLLQFITEKQVDAVIVPSISHLSRDAQQVQFIRRELRQRKIKLHTASDQQIWE